MTIRYAGHISRMLVVGSAAAGREESGFDETYTGGYDLLNFITRYQSDNLLTPTNTYSPNNPFNPVNRYDPDNPTNPINPINPVNRYRPENPLNPVQIQPPGAFCAVGWGARGGTLMHGS